MNEPDQPINSQQRSQRTMSVGRLVMLVVLGVLIAFLIFYAIIPFFSAVSSRGSTNSEGGLTLLLFGTPVFLVVIVVVTLLISGLRKKNRG